MFDIDRWTEIWVTITRNKTRSLMTCFGVFWGILMLVLLLGTGSGFKNAMFKKPLTNSRRIRYSSPPITPATPTKDSTRGETGT